MNGQGQNMVAPSGDGAGSTAACESCGATGSWVTPTGRCNECGDIFDSTAPSIYTHHSASIGTPEAEAALARSLAAIKREA